MDNCECTRTFCLTVKPIETVLHNCYSLPVLGVLVGGTADGYSFHHIYGIIYQVLCRAHSFH